jgi:hypothetical protein
VAANDSKSRCQHACERLQKIRANCGATSRLPRGEPSRGSLPCCGVTGEKVRCGVVVAPQSEGRSRRLMGKITHHPRMKFRKIRILIVERLLVAACQRWQMLDWRPDAEKAFAKTCAVPDPLEGSKA